MSMNKTMKKFNNVDPDYTQPPPSNSKNKNQKPVYLFYRTPSNKDNKKIEFQN